MKTRWLCIWLIPAITAASPFERGVQAKAAGDKPRAVRELAIAVKEQPDNAEAWYHYGVVLGWQDRHEEALAAIDRGLSIAPADYDLRVARARVIAWQGNYELASAEFAKLADENPADDDVVVMQGRIASWQGRPDEAAIHYQTVIDRNPRQVDALTGLGDLARDRRKRTEAMDFYQLAMEVGPSPDLQQRIDQLENEKLMRLDFGLTASTFADSARSDWWSVWTQLSRATDWGNFWGRIEQGERFEEQDNVLEIGWEGRTADSLSNTAILGGSQDALWAPEWYAEVGALWSPQAGWPALAAELRHAQYVTRGVWTLRTGLVYNFGNGWSGAARWVHQDFEGGLPTDGWILSLDKEYESGLGWRIGAASGAESLDGQILSRSGEVLHSQTWSASIRGLFNDNWGWQASLEYEDVRGGIDRRGAAVSIYRRF